MWRVVGLAVPVGIAETLQATAFVAAACRAEETRQEHPRVVDPLADRFLSEVDGVNRALLAWGREEVVQRTLHIDQFLMAALERWPGLVLLNLGAGLCTRPYRLDLSACAQVIEVDASPILELKDEKLRGIEPSCPVRRAVGDVRFGGTPSTPDAPILILTEGMLVYLPVAEVRGLAAELAQRPGVVQWIADVVSVESAQAMAAIAGRAQAGLDLFGLASLDPFEAEGWAVADYRLLPATRRAPVRSSRQVADGVVAMVRTMLG